MPVTQWTPRNLSHNESPRLNLRASLYDLPALLDGGWSPGIHSSSGLVCGSDRNAYASTPLKLYYVSRGMKQQRLNLLPLNMTSSGVLHNCHPKSGTKSVKDGLCAGPPKACAPQLSLPTASPPRDGSVIFWGFLCSGRPRQPGMWTPEDGVVGEVGLRLPVCRPAGEKGPSSQKEGQVPVMQPEGRWLLLAYL